MHLKDFATLTLPNAGLYIYIRFNKPHNLSSILDELIDKGVLDPYKNQHVNFRKPIGALRIGYAIFPISLWESIFVIVAKNCTE